ncbi:hypothetical protein WA026_014121 [Henosepilachna vigintioctopunctata]|uniref:Uncharacterized protein n=1 Tax=Henosepilachna vigintioctopunctata TaxID=420089 RepID=A0AAW1TN34_9CUCU
MYIRKKIEEINRNKDIHEYFTRNFDQLGIEKHLTSKYKRSCDYMGIMCYNKLPKKISDIKSIKAFELSVKNLLIKKGYYTVKEYMEDTTFEEIQKPREAQENKKKTLQLHIIIVLFF